MVPTLVLDPEIRDESDPPRVVDGPQGKDMAFVGEVESDKN